MCGCVFMLTVVFATSLVEKDGWNDFNKNGVRDIFENKDCPVEQRIDDLLGRMTELEKGGQLNQLILEASKTNRQFEAQHRGEVGSYIFGLGNPDLRNDYQLDQVENARLGIPLIFGNDVIHGESMAFPSSIGLACAFEPELFEKAQAEAASEARTGGIDWVFAPMCDIARDPPKLSGYVVFRVRPPRAMSMRLLERCDWFWSVYANGDPVAVDRGGVIESWRPAADLSLAESWNEIVFRTSPGSGGRWDVWLRLLDPHDEFEIGK